MHIVNILGAWLGNKINEEGVWAPILEKREKQPHNGRTPSNSPNGDRREE